MEQELRDFGLSENETTVYLALLKIGVTSANRIAEITGLKRSTTYDNLNLLQNKGVVSTFMKNEVNFYQAADPKKLVAILDDKKSRLQKIIPKLILLQETISEKTGVTFYEGKKGVITVLNDILDERKELLFYGSRKMANFALQQYPDNFIQKRAEQGIQLRAVLAEEDRNDPTYDTAKIRKVSSLRFFRSLNGSLTNVFIYSDRVAFMTSSENLVGIIIKNPDIVAQQKSIFEMLWQISEK